MTLLQVRLLGDRIGRIPTNPAGVTSTSGARYLMNDIQEYGIQPLLLCGLDHQQARHFIDWVLGINSDIDNGVEGEDESD
jgi:hypothetical protein